MFPGIRLQKHSTPKGFHRGIKKQDEPVPLSYRHRLFKPELHISFFSGFKLCRVQKDCLAVRPGRTKADMYPTVIFQGVPGISEQLHTGVQHHGWNHPSRPGDNFSSLQLFLTDVRQIQRGSLTRKRPFFLLVMALYGTNPDPFLLRVNHQLFPCGTGALKQRSSHNRSHTFQGKNAICRKPEHLRICSPCGSIPDIFKNQFLQLRNIFSCERRDTDPGGMLQKASLYHLICLCFHHTDQFFIRQIQLRKYKNSPWDVQHFQDLKMLPGLRHNALIQSNNQQNQVYATDSRKHIPDKFLVSGNIYNADPQSFLIRQAGKAVFNGNSSLFFLCQPVGVCSG